MDYVEGEDLSAYLTRKGTLSEDELKGILYPLLDALEVVHGADFLHRDIKPGNIVLRDADGSPVLLDFGAARQAIGAKSRSVTSIVTPGYAPIEQYSSRGRQGAWTDLYALGGVCYRALTGRCPTMRRIGCGRTRWFRYRSGVRVKRAVDFCRRSIWHCRWMRGIVRRVLGLGGWRWRLGMIRPKSRRAGDGKCTRRAA